MMPTYSSVQLESSIRIFADRFDRVIFIIEAHSHVIQFEKNTILVVDSLKQSQLSN